MRKLVNTYRITISDEMKQKLHELKYRFNIIPTSFIRIAIEEKLKRDLPNLKIKESKIKDAPDWLYDN